MESESRWGFTGGWVGGEQGVGLLAGRGFPLGAMKTSWN